MTSITRIRRVHDALDRHFWPALAAELQAAWRAAGVGLRDAIVLLPQAGALAPARAAFAALGGWQPRIETVRTLASSLTPPATAAAGAPSLDRGNDRLQAAALLRRQAFGREWAARDPRAFDAAAAAVVDTAHALFGAAHARPRVQRAAHGSAFAEDGRGAERTAIDATERAAFDATERAAIDATERAAIDATERAAQ